MGKNKANHKKSGSIEAESRKCVADDVSSAEDLHDRNFVAQLIRYSMSVRWCLILAASEPPADIAQILAQCYLHCLCTFLLVVVGKRSEVVGSPGLQRWLARGCSSFHRSLPF